MSKRTPAFEWRYFVGGMAIWMVLGVVVNAIMMPQAYFPWLGLTCGPIAGVAYAGMALIKDYYVARQQGVGGRDS